LVILAGFGCASAYREPADAKKRRLDLAEYAYSTGCYEAYQSACARIRDDVARSSCHEEGLKNCEPVGKKFRQWIEQNPASGPAGTQGPKTP
jgi:hypothetical protein